MSVIDDLKSREVNGYVVLPQAQGLKPGDRVRVVRGLLQGQIGLVAGMQPRQRIEVLLTLLGASRSVVLPKGDIEEASRRPVFFGDLICANLLLPVVMTRVPLMELAMSGDYADYEQLATAHRQQCYERRQREAELNAKPCASEPKHPDIVTRAGGELVYKTNPNARVPAPPASAPAVAHVDGYAFNDHQADILARLVAEQRKQMRAHVAAEVEGFKREIFVLREEMRLEREVRALHDEVAAARADVPKIPEIEARTDAKQSKLAAEQKRLERELAKTKERLGKVHVNQSLTDYELRKHIKQSPVGVELHF